MTDNKIRPTAEFIYNLRQKHNLQGSEKEDWKQAERLLIELQTEDMLRRKYGKTTNG